MQASFLEQGLDLWLLPLGLGSRLIPWHWAESALWGSAKALSFFSLSGLHAGAESRHCDIWFVLSAAWESDTLCAPPPTTLISLEGWDQDVAPAPWWVAGCLRGMGTDQMDTESERTGHGMNVGHQVLICE